MSGLLGHLGLLLANDSGLPPATAHRYWRVNGFAVSGAQLEISELVPHFGGVSTQVQFTASDTPGGGGALSNLIDGSLSTRVYWADTVAEAGGFYLRWDFGAPRVIDGVRLGGYDTSDRYPTGFALEHSDDGSTWTTQATVSGLSYPGNNTLSSTIDVAGSGATYHRYWRINAIVVAGAFFEVSEVQLLSGGVTPFPQISASDTPSGGAIDLLFDGSLSTRNAWADTVAEAGGFWIRFDFGGLAEVDGLKVGAYDDSSRYPSQLTLQYSDNGSTWTTWGSASGLSYPGNNTLSALITPT
jgi:hypothetical protein